MDNNKKKSILMIAVSIIAIVAIIGVVYTQQQYNTTTKELKSLHKVTTEMESTIQQKEQKLKDLNTIYQLIGEFDDLKSNVIYITYDSQENSNYDLYNTYYNTAYDNLKNQNEDLMRIYGTYTDYTIDYNKLLLDIFAWININTKHKSFDTDSCLEIIEMIDDAIKEIEEVRDSILK